MHYQGLPPLEMAFTKLLPPQYQWLVWWFYYSSELFWSMLPSLLVLSLFWFIKGRFLIQDSGAFLTQALQSPDHPLHGLIETKITKATQIDEQSATIDLMRDERISEFYKGKAEDLARTAMAKATEYYKNQLASAEKRNVADEEKVKFIEDRLNAVQQQLQGELPQALYKKIASIINSTAKTTIEKADQERFRKLALTTSNTDHELLQELCNKVLCHDESLRGLSGLPAEVNELKVGTKQQMDGLRSAISEQDESIDTEVLSKLQDKIDDHDTQFHSFAKVSSDLKKLETVVRTFAEPLRQLKDVVSTVQAMESSFQKHDIQTTETSGASTSIKTLIKQHEKLAQRIQEVEKDVSREVSDHELILTLQSQMEKFEAPLVELSGVPSQVSMLDERTKSVEDKVAHQEELSNQLKATATDVDNLTTRSKASDDTLDELHTNVSKSAGDIESINGDTKDIQGQAHDVITSIQGPETIDEIHGEQLKEFHKSANEYSKAVEELEPTTVDTAADAAVDSPLSVSASKSAINILPASDTSAEDLEHASRTSETISLPEEEVPQTSSSTDPTVPAITEASEASSSKPSNDATPALSVPGPKRHGWSELFKSVSTPSASDSKDFPSTQHPNSHTSGSDAAASSPRSSGQYPPMTTSDESSAPSTTQTSPLHEDTSTSKPASRSRYDETEVPEWGEALDSLYAELGEERLDDDAEMYVEEDLERDSDSKNAPKVGKVVEYDFDGEDTY
ncbi:hypothetical protein N0V95_007171 [Ascochyta clinopodiicola]|nr:hypothetical protein N0V95_007171 [Ascochyta clinopodiicola]